MKSKKSNLKVAMSLAALLSTTVLFQNCGQKSHNYSQIEKATSVEGEISSDYIEHIDDDTIIEVITPDEESNQDGQTNGGGTNGSGSNGGLAEGGISNGGSNGGGGSTVGGSNGNSNGGTTNGSTTGGSNGGTGTGLFNFVSDREEGCSGAIQSRFGMCYKCSIGGGCGISCGKPGASCPSANPNAWGACLRQTDASNCTIPVNRNKVCKVFGADGSSSATNVETIENCQAYYQELKTKNPQWKISHVTFDGRVIVENRRICKVVFNDGAVASTLVYNQAKCLKYYEQLKDNNPRLSFKKVTFDGQIINF